MRARGALAALLALVLLAACGRGPEEPSQPEGPVLWFLADQPAMMGQTAGGGVHGPALCPQGYEGELTAQAMLTALLAGPSQEGLASPFPRGVALRGCAFDPDRPGVLEVRLSEQYGALTDIGLTLGDYCIVLTLSQVEGVEQVEIVSQGRGGSYRSHQTMSAREAVLEDALALAQDGP